MFPPGTNHNFGDPFVFRLCHRQVKKLNVSNALLYDQINSKTKKKCVEKRLDRSIMDEVTAVQNFIT